MMRAPQFAGAVAAALLLVGSAQAQQPAAAGQPPPDPKAKSPASAEDMGVSLKNIRRQVGPPPAPAERKSGNGLTYNFFVDVLGTKPKIDFFKDFDLSTKGGVRWGGPTHQEVLDVMSPYWVRQGRPAGSGFDVLSAIRNK